MARPVVQDSDLSRLRAVQGRVRKLAQNHVWFADAVRAAFEGQLKLGERYLRDCDALRDLERRLAREVLVKGLLTDPLIKNTQQPSLVVRVEGLCPNGLVKQVQNHKVGEKLPKVLGSKWAAAALAAFDRDRKYQSRVRSDSEGERMAAEYRAIIATQTHKETTWNVWVAEPKGWEVPPHPYSLDRSDLERFDDSDYLTIALYWLGGLADTGSLRPILRKPKETGEWRDVPVYSAWRGRFIIDDGDFRRSQPPLSTEELPPSLAEQMLEHVEFWAKKEATKHGETLAPRTSTLNAAELLRRISMAQRDGTELNDPPQRRIRRPLTKNELLGDIDCGNDVFRAICRKAGIKHGLKGGAAANYNYALHVRELIAVVKSGKWRCSQELHARWEKISASMPI